MKKSTLSNLITTTLGVCAFSAFVGFAAYIENMPDEVIRTESARYYAEGYVVTTSDLRLPYAETMLGDAFQATDGSVIFSGIEHEPKNDVPVWVRINDNGTPEDFADDFAEKVGLDFCEYMDEVIAENDRYIAELQAKNANKQK